MHFSKYWDAPIVGTETSNNGGGVPLRPSQWQHIDFLLAVQHTLSISGPV